MTLNITLLSLHLIGVGALVGVVFASLYYVYKVKTIEQLKDFITLRRIGAAGATLAILSGIAIAYKWIDGLRQDPVFLTKMGLVLADGLIAEFGFIKVLKDAIKNNSTDGVKKKLLPWAILSVIIVIGIIAISAFRDKNF